jgi:hypothetical protein
VGGVPPDGLGGDALTVRLEGFAREALERESARLGVPAQDLASFAVMYYLADVDSGRIARRSATVAIDPGVDVRRPLGERGL